MRKSIYEFHSLLLIEEPNKRAGSFSGSSSYTQYPAGQCPSLSPDSYSHRHIMLLRHLTNPIIEHVNNPKRNELIYARMNPNQQRFFDDSLCNEHPFRNI